MKEKTLNVVFVSSECGPYAATGGLADVVSSLPEALSHYNSHIIKIIPKYKSIEDTYDLEKVFSFMVETSGKERIAHVFKKDEEAVTTYFIGNEDYFERDAFYGYTDDDERFGFFCKAVVEMLLILDYKPDIVHINDWQAAMVALLIKEELYRLDFYKDIKVVFTIHNLQYQGTFHSSILERLNLSNTYLNMESLEYYNNVCFMKAGIIYSDLVTTVSRTYAIEIQNPIYGYGLDGILRKYKYKIRGILNGINLELYNPKKDKIIKACYDSRTVVDKKPINQRHLRQLFELPDASGPVAGIITRLTEQKGIELVIEAIKACREDDIQFVVLGTGDPLYEHKLMELAEWYPNQVKVRLEFSPAIAKQIYAGCDMFLMPSLFEPCGLSQLYSLRYGAVPIVRKTGGLADTIKAFNERTLKGTGFLFEGYNTQSFVSAIRSALALYEDKEKWYGLVQNGMKECFSWDESAKEYMQLYNEILNASIG